MSQLRGHLFFPLVRWLERCVPVSWFCRLLTPPLALRAAVHGWHKGGPVPLTYPAGLNVAATRATRLSHRFPLYVSRVIETIPDRLHSRSWLARCRFTGLEAVHEARAERHGVVLAFAHFGGYRLLRHWLRAAGLPAALLVGAPIGTRSRLLQRADRKALFPEVPLAFDGDRIADAIRFLEAGNCLGVAIDGATGRQVTVPVGPGGEMQMATGPIRMARRHRAALIPCSVVYESAWRYHIEFGQPTPEELLRATSDLPAAAHLVQQFLPIWREHPEQWTADLSRCFRPATQSNQPVSHLVA